MNFALQFLLHHTGAVIFLWMFLAHLGLPIPAIPLMLAVGALAGVGYISPGNAILVAFVATTIGDIVLFFIARSRGKNILGMFCKIAIDPDSCVRRTRLLLLLYGARFLIAANFIPGVSTLAAPLAGTSRMKFQTFFVCDGVGNLIWILFFFALGYFFGAEVEEQAKSMLGAIHWIGILFLVSILLFAVWKVFQRRKKFIAADRSCPDYEIFPAETKKNQEI